MNPEIPADVWKIWLPKSFGLTVLYFYLLKTFDEGLLFWLVLLGGWLGLIWF